MIMALLENVTFVVSFHFVFFLGKLEPWLPMVDGGMAGFFELSRQKLGPCESAALARSAE